MKSDHAVTDAFFDKVGIGSGVLHGVLHQISLAAADESVPGQSAAKEEEYPNGKDQLGRNRPLYMLQRMVTHFSGLLAPFFIS